MSFLHDDDDDDDDDVGDDYTTINTITVVAAERLLVDCFTFQQDVSVSQGRICSGKSTCCHTGIEVAHQTV